MDIKKLMDSFSKKFGDGVVHRIGDGPVVVDCEVIPTGALSLDKALGVGGIPKGRIVEIYGPEGHGKTTLALSIVAQCQKQGGVAAFIDAEHSLNKGWAENMGVNINELLISQPDSGEQALEIAQFGTSSNEIDLIVIDSVAALVPQAELDGDIGDHNIGGQARLMSQALRKLAPNLKKSDTTLIFINQIREKIGVMFGSPETTPGGRSLKFYSSVRIEVRKKSQITAKDPNAKKPVPIGHSVRAKIVKNKMAPPFAETTFNVMFGHPLQQPDPVWGIDYYSSLLDAACELNVIKQSGSWYSFNDEKIGNGEQNAISYLKDNHDITKDIESNVINEFYINKMKNRKNNNNEEKPDVESE